MSIRGWPKEMHSDNGSQLVAASKELRDSIRNLNHGRIQRESLIGGLSRKFCTADAQWMNGATEALVKSVKRAIRTILGNQVLTFSEIQTVMYESAQLVTQKSIGRNPTQPEDGSYLCPNDLLLGRDSPRAPQGPFRGRTCVKYRLDFVEELAGQFWKKWIKDMFPNLIIQPKWHVKKRDVCVGDAVLMQGTNIL